MHKTIGGGDLFFSYSFVQQSEQLKNWLFQNGLTDESYKNNLPPHCSGRILRKRFLVCLIMGTQNVKFPAHQYLSGTQLAAILVVSSKKPVSLFFRTLSHGKH